jgi:hypothetical protein
MPPRVTIQRKFLKTLCFQKKQRSRIKSFLVPLHPLLPLNQRNLPRQNPRKIPRRFQPKRTCCRGVEISFDSLQEDSGFQGASRNLCKGGVIWPNNSLQEPLGYLEEFIN